MRRWRVAFRAEGSDDTQWMHGTTDPARATAFTVVADELMLDGNARQNLATFCQTWVEPEVMGLMALSALPAGRPARAAFRRSRRHPRQSARSPSHPCHLFLAIIH